MVAGFRETRLELPSAPNYSLASNGSSRRVKPRENIRNRNATKSVLRLQWRITLGLQITNFTESAYETFDQAERAIRAHSLHRFCSFRFGLNPSHHCSISGSRQIGQRLGRLAGPHARRPFLFNPPT